MPTHLWQGTWQGCTPAGDTHQRARQVISPSGGIVRGKFPSRKNGRMVHHEGLLELDAIYLFETSPGIALYREQPETLSYPDGARLRRYTPDFELKLSSGECVLIEIKPLRGLQDDVVRHKLDMVFEWSGVKFRIERLQPDGSVLLERVADGNLSLAMREDLLAEFAGGRIAEIARHNHTSSRQMLSQLSATPVCGPSIDGSRQYFFRRLDVEQYLPGEGNGH